MKRVLKFSTVPMFLLFAAVAGAQTPTEKADTSKPETKVVEHPNAFTSGRVDTRPLEMIFLKNSTASNQANEILTSLRLMLEPEVKLYLVPTQNAFLLRCTPEQFVLAKRVVDQLDLAPKAYRVTYTVTELEGTKRLGVQHYEINTTSGLRTVLKQGSHITVPSTSTQNQSYDVGLSFDLTAESIAGGVQLKSKVDQSTIAPSDSADNGPRTPVIRQSTLEGSAVVPIGKPTLLGSLDISGSTRHLDIEVVVDALK